MQNIKKTGGLGLQIGLGLRESIGIGLGLDRVRAGDEVILFEKHPTAPPPKKK